MPDEATSIPIIRTKLDRPPVPEGHVRRPLLLKRHDDDRRRLLALVSAPAGYVKNTLVSMWLEVCDCPNARLQMPENEKGGPAGCEEDSFREGASRLNDAPA